MESRDHNIIRKLDCKCGVWRLDREGSVQRNICKRDALQKWVSGQDQRAASAEKAKRSSAPPFKLTLEGNQTWMCMDHSGGTKRVNFDRRRTLYNKTRHLEHPLPDTALV